MSWESEQTVRLLVQPPRELHPNAAGVKINASWRPLPALGGTPRNRSGEKKTPRETEGQSRKEAVVGAEMRRTPHQNSAHTAFIPRDPLARSSLGPETRLPREIRGRQYFGKGQF